MTTPTNLGNRTGSGRIRASGLITMLILTAACLVPEHSTAAKPRRLAPGVPCTTANRMDIFVDEDSILYECECQMLMLGTLCAWQVIGGVESTAVRKFRKHHRRLVIAYAKPPVIA